MEINRCWEHLWSTMSVTVCTITCHHHKIVNLDDSDFETSLAPENHLIIHLLTEDLESDILYLPPIDSG